MYNFNNKKNQKMISIICIVVLAALVITSILGAFLL